ncbi:MAG: ATP phosphoribosyltransferase [Lentisphaeria bacterium]|jgi:ATP phosphoribosyltransferase
MLQIALPNKGALAEEALTLVKAAGYNCRKDEKTLLVRDAENDIEFYFLRPRDIAVYVSNGVLALGITGRDLALESQMPVVELLPLGFAKSTFRYAVPQASDLTPERFGGLRIAASYPNLVRQDLAKRGLEGTVVELDGAVEISVKLGVADAIADVVESGRTLEQAGLKVVGEPILRSEAVVVGRDAAVAETPAARKFLERLRGIVVARDYVMVEYDVPRAALAEACRITPGIESPTVAPLSEPDWAAVKAMARRKEVNRILDGLSALGAKGIIITDIRTCRI